MQRDESKNVLSAIVEEALITVLHYFHNFWDSTRNEGMCLLVHIAVMLGPLSTHDLLSTPVVTNKFSDIVVESETYPDTHSSNICIYIVFDIQ